MLDILQERPETHESKVVLNLWKSLETQAAFISSIISIGVWRGTWGRPETGWPSGERIDMMGEWDSEL